MTTFIPVRIKRPGRRKVVVPAAAKDGLPTHDAPMLTALSKAWQRLIDEGIVKSGSDIARHGGLHQTMVNEPSRLTLLSPTLVKPPAEDLESVLVEEQAAVGLDEQHVLFNEFDGQNGFARFLVRALDAPNPRPETRMKSRDLASGSHRSNGEKRGLQGPPGWKMHHRRDDETPGPFEGHASTCASGQNKSPGAAGLEGMWWCWVYYRTTRYWGQ